MDWKKLPKVELHLHLDCSLSYDVVSEINPSITLNDYRTYFVAPSKCENLMDFLSRVPNSLALIQTKKQLHQVTVDLFRQLKAENVLYAEIRLPPSSIRRKACLHMMWSQQLRKLPLNAVRTQVYTPG